MADGVEWSVEDDGSLEVDGDQLGEGGPQVDQQLGPHVPEAWQLQTRRPMDAIASGEIWTNTCLSIIVCKAAGRWPCRNEHKMAAGPLSTGS